MHLVKEKYWQIEKRKKEHLSYIYKNLDFFPYKILKIYI